MPCAPRLPHHIGLEPALLPDQLPKKINRERVLARGLHDFAIECGPSSLVRRFVDLGGRYFARCLARPLRGRRRFRCFQLGGDVLRRHLSDAWACPKTNDGCDDEFEFPNSSLSFRMQQTAPIQVPSNRSRVR